MLNGGEPPSGGLKGLWGIGRATEVARLGVPPGHRQPRSAQGRVAYLPAAPG